MRYIQMVALVGAITLGIIAAAAGKWEMVTAVVTGLFAVLNMGGGKHESSGTGNTGV